MKMKAFHINFLDSIRKAAITKEQITTEHHRNIVRTLLFEGLVEWSRYDSLLQITPLGRHILSENGK